MLGSERLGAEVDCRKYEFRHRLNHRDRTSSVKHAVEAQRLEEVEHLTRGSAHFFSSFLDNYGLLSRRGHSERPL
jgi:hypothetical protein